MKAIYIPYNFDPNTDLDKLNKEIKECHSVEFKTEIKVDYLKNPIGILIIVGNHTRKDKLKKLNKISNEKSNNNSL